MIKNRDYTEGFKKSKRFKVAAIILIIGSLTPQLFIDGNLGIWLTITILGLAFIISRGYKCPACGEVFDIRMSANKYDYCPSCGNRINSAMTHYW